MAGIWSRIREYALIAVVFLIVGSLLVGVGGYLAVQRQVEVVSGLAERLEHQINRIDLLIDENVKQVSNREKQLRQAVSFLAFKLHHGKVLSDDDYAFLQEALSIDSTEIGRILDSIGEQQRVSLPGLIKDEWLKDERKKWELGNRFLIKFYESKRSDLRLSELDFHGGGCRTKTIVDRQYPDVSAKICYTHLEHKGEPRLELVLTKDILPTGTSGNVNPRDSQ